LQCSRGWAVPAFPAKAIPIPYKFVDATATFQDGTDTISGNFLYDPATMIQDLVVITLTGDIAPGTYPAAGSCACGGFTTNDSPT
jgi:hypothetical protein